MLDTGDAAMADYEPIMAWEMRPATDKQKAALEKWNITVTEDMTCGLASQIMSKLIERRDQNLATPKQLHKLRQYHLPRVEEWTFSEAAQFIDWIAARHWIVPPGFVPENFLPPRLRGAGAA